MCSVTGILRDKKKKVAVQRHLPVMEAQNVQRVFGLAEARLTPLVKLGPGRKTYAPRQQGYELEGVLHIQLEDA